MPNNPLKARQAPLLAIGIGVIVYALVVLMDVSSSHEIGVQSVLSPQVLGEPTNARPERGPMMRAGDRIVSVADLPIQIWWDLLEAPGILQERIQRGEAPTGVIQDEAEQIFVLVTYQSPESPEPRQAWCELRRFPLEEMIPSLIWLFLKGSLFVIGVIVYWKRPEDESALRFYILCVVTLGAYMGGYHWTHIVTQPVLMIVFMICAILLPVVSLHFYLVFPHKKFWLAKYPGRTLSAVYGPPLLLLSGLIAIYTYIACFAAHDSRVRQYLPAVIYAAFGTAMLYYLACMAALFHSVRTTAEGMEHKQVRCIGIGVFFSHFPIGYSLFIVLFDPQKFIEGAVTWPMFGASLIVTLAFAIGMTRYRLLELDKIINSSIGYFLVSFLAGLMYYAVVFIGTLFYSRLVSSPTLPAAITVSTTALLFVLILDAARRRLQQALDRRFSRNKLQLDQTLEQMSQAVSQLVDPPVLAERLLLTVRDTLDVPTGAIYLRAVPNGGFYLAASHASQAAAELPLDAPLIDTLRTGLGLACPDPAEEVGSPAQRQLRELGGAVAQPLLSDGVLEAILILGPKDPPYRAEDWNLLAAFARISIVAFESAAKHRTIDELNRELKVKVDKIAEQQRRIFVLQTQLKQSADPVTPVASNPKTDGDGVFLPTASGIVGSSPVLRQLLTLVRKVAATDAVVLLRGESGTGKELLARAVHDTSARAGKPYVKVHCAALSASLLESELFGHVKGAFTGAHKDKVGRFELADGGTLFLDEIGDISLDVQTKLLRVLQEKTIERVGSSDSLKVDVRIIAATHQNLEDLIRHGRFREDLFYRLNVFPIRVPALRERAEDIAELAMFFIQLSAQRSRRNVVQIEDDALALLKAHAWPGNIRQLENVIERAVVITEGEVLTLQDMPPELFEAPSAGGNGKERPMPEFARTAPSPNYRSEREHFEREKIVGALNAADGNKAEAARILGIARTTLVSRMKKLGLE